MPPVTALPIATSTIPVRCIETNPRGRGIRPGRGRTVRFKGQPINLTHLKDTYDPPLDHGHVSRILQGKVWPSILYSRMMANALGMTVQSFIDEIIRIREETEARKPDVLRQPTPEALKLLRAAP